MAELYDFTDRDGDGLRVTHDGSNGYVTVSKDTGPASVELPTGEEAVALAEAVLANPGPGDVRYVVVPEWRVIDPAELAAEKRAYAEAVARSVRERAIDAAMRTFTTPGPDDVDQRIAIVDAIRALPLSPDAPRPARSPLTADTDT